MALPALIAALFLFFVSTTNAADCEYLVDPSVSTCTDDKVCPNLKETIAAGFNNPSCSNLYIEIKSGTYTGTKNTNLALPSSSTIQWISFGVNLQSPGLVVFDGEGKNVIFYGDSLSYSVLFNNVTFTNGYLDGDSHTGGCLSLTNMKGGVSLEQVTFTGCNAPQSQGGGAYISVVWPSGAVIVSNSHFSKNNAVQGGGLWLTCNGLDCQVNGTVFAYNSASGGLGGGLYVYSAPQTPDPRVTYCDFYGNTAVYGGGMAIAQSALVSNSQFHLNSAKLDGGGLYVKSARVNETVQLNVLNIYSNDAGRSGGGLYVSDCVGALAGSKVGSNKANSFGGGVYLTMDTDFRHSSTFDFVDVEIESNWAHEGGGGFYCLSANSHWRDVLVSQSVMKNASYPDVYCDSICKSNFCSTCTCDPANRCADCKSSNSCALTQDSKCQCFLEETDAKAQCGSKAGLIIGVLFGVFVVVLLVVLLGYFALRQLNKKRREERAPILTS